MFRRTPGRSAPVLGSVRPIPRGSELLVESAIADLFEKKGHEFVDLDVAAYLLDTQEPVMSARLRALYRLRGPA